jgi:hypothetical protein
MKGACVVAIVAGRMLEGYIVASYGGQVNDDLNIWEEEFENSRFIGDIFYREIIPDLSPGFWVWEGEMTYVYDDAPCLVGAWRKASLNDLKLLIDG